MAEDDPYKEDFDFATWAIGLILVLSVLGGIAASLQSRFGIDFSDPAGSIENIRARWGESPLFSDDTPIGTIVETLRDVQVWGEAGGGNLQAIAKKGIRGIIIDGPVRVGGARWWKVEFKNGLVGWVQEGDLEIIPFRARLVGFLKKLSLVSSLLFLVLIIYSFIRINQIRKFENVVLSALLHKGGDKIRNERWQKVLEKLESDNPSDWRLSILEADIMLDELTNEMGYHGDSIGDKLKGVEKSDFTTIENAWEAHKVRNAIAHHGADFILTQREARRVIGLFESVFKEFKII